MIPYTKKVYILRVFSYLYIFSIVFNEKANSGKCSAEMNVA